MDKYLAKIKVSLQEQSLVEMFQVVVKSARIYGRGRQGQTIIDQANGLLVYLRSFEASARGEYRSSKCTMTTDQA
jgi:hypothetical protein